MNPNSSYFNAAASQNGGGGSCKRQGGEEGHLELALRPVNQTKENWQWFLLRHEACNSAIVSFHKLCKFMH